MNDHLEKAKEVLRNFLKGFSEVQKHISPSSSYWEKENAYTWVYGAKRYIPLMRRMGAMRPPPPFYSQLVQPLFTKWLSLFLDVQNKESYRIPDPLNNETVQGYLERLQSILIDQKERRQIWWLSLRSFTNFLRDEARRRIEDLGELDILFPEEMTIYFDSIDLAPFSIPQPG